jgi:hypothetical protein
MTGQDLEATVAAQQRVIEALEQRLEALERRDRGDDDGAEPVDRRRLLGKAGAMAAGAVATGVAVVLGDASPAQAAPGVFDGNPAVSATANPSSAIGVLGTSTSGAGVYGSSQQGTGVYGVTTSATPGSSNGVVGLSGASSGPNSFGVTAGALGEGVGLYAASNAGMTMRLNTSSLPVPLPSGSSQLVYPGCIVYNSSGLWFCYENPDGQPQNGKWVRLDSGPIILDTPKRVYDARPGQQPNVAPKTPLEAATPRTVDLKAASSGVPAGATAALLSVTATGTVTGVGGFLSVYRNGIGWPGTSNLNWSGPGQTIAVTTLTATDAQSRIRLYAGSPTDVVVDVLAYYR